VRLPDRLDADELRAIGKLEAERDALAEMERAVRVFLALPEPRSTFAIEAMLQKVAEVRSGA